jgi:predicted amidohydrolase
MKIAMTLGRVGCALLAAGLMTELSAAPFVSRADSPPRKIVVASALANFSGSVEARLELAGKLIDAAAQEAAAKYPGGRFDLMVLPEFAILRETGITAKERAVSLEGVVGETLGAKAREHRAWFIVPMTLREAEGRISNAAVLFGRDGKVAGIFRKVHPMLDADGATFEGGVTPGGAYPVFECVFGRLGILMCWDMSYEDAWAALAAKGAELVALPSASPQTLRPAAAALRHHYYVVNSAPRDNASVFDPIGRTIAQVTEPGVVVQQVDLAYAILHWSEGLKNGTALAERFGERAGGDYSSREDTGVFWSNDPNQSVGEMVRELGLKEMPQVIEEVGAAAERRL